MKKIKCYIKVSKDDLQLIEAIADNVKDLSDMCGVEPCTILKLIPYSNTCYEKVILEIEDPNDYVNQICGNCKYLDIVGNGNAGYPCTCLEKTWSKNNTRRKKQKKQNACKHFELRD